MSEIHGAVGAYVVNALDPAELEEFEAHLAVCPTCSREVVEFCETAAELSLLTTLDAPPPPALRGSVLAAIKDVRVLPPIPPAGTAPPEVASAGSASSGPASGGPASDGPASDGPASGDPASGDPASGAPEPRSTRANELNRVDEVAARRQQRRTRVLSMLVAAALVAALGLGGVVYSLVQGQRAQVAQQTAETQLLSAKDARIYTATMKNGGQISFVVSKELNSALFVGRGLPPTPGDQTYQLWTLAGSRAIRDTLVSGGGDRKAFMDGTLSGVTGLAISVERAGGAEQPTVPAIQAVVELT